MVTRWHRMAWGIGVAACGVAAIGLRVAAQEANTSPGTTASASAAAAPTGVSVPDSPASVDLLDKAAAKEQQQQWSAAADFYHQLLSKYAGRVVPGQVDADKNLFRYTGVATVVAEHLARWPAEGLAAYQSSFGPAAADALAAVNGRPGPPDLAALDQIFTTAFVTDAGKTAGIELLDCLYESGRFAQAAAVGDRLLQNHPSLTVERPAVLFRTAVCRYRANDLPAARRLLDSLRQQSPAATGTVAGQDVVLVDALTTLLASPVPAPHVDPLDADTWPTFAGPADHAGISASTASAGASITRLELIPPSLTGLDLPRRNLYQQSDENGLAQGQGVGIMPVTDGHGLFFQDGRHLYAVDLASGRPLPGWLASYPAAPGDGAARGGQGGVYELKLPGLAGQPRGEQLTTTVTPSVVLAVMGQPDHSPFSGAIAMLPPPPRVVALDRETGKLLWSVATLDLPESSGNARTAIFAGPVRVVDPDVQPDSLLVCAIGGRERQFAECYLVCLSLRTGKYQWSTYLGSATQSFDGEPTADQPLTPQLTVAGTTAYVSTNVGTVAAVEVAGGITRWLGAYPRDGVDIGDPNAFRARLQGIAPPATPKPWAFNPPVISGGLVYVLPADSKALHVYDADTGVERQRIPTSDYDDADVLLGVEAPTADAPAGVVLTTAKGIYCLDPAAYVPDDAGRAILWERKDVAADTKSDDENTLFGRGLLTADSALLSTRHRLYQLSTRTGGKVVAMIPSRGEWGTAGAANEPGNVLATAEDVIVAGSRGIDIYADLARVKRHFADLMSAAPNDPAPRIALADALFNAGDPRAALDELDQAIARTGSAGGPLPAGDTQRSILAEALGFARRTAALALPPPAAADIASAVPPGSSPPDVAGPDEAMSSLTDLLFDRARTAALTPAERVQYLLSRARFDRDRKDDRAEVLLCQQILNDPSTRTLAGDDAAAEIADVQSSDPGAYAPVQQQADTALVTAQAANEPGPLLAIADTYPNSTAGATALENAATLDESRGDGPAAVTALRRAYGGAAFSADAAEKNARRLERIARDFAASPGGGPAAIDRLCAALRWQPNLTLSDPMSLSPLAGGAVLPAGTPAPAAVATLRTLLAPREEAALPNFRLAATPAWATADWSEDSSGPGQARVGHITSLLLPQTAGLASTAGRPDRVVAVTDAGLSVFAPGETTPRWTATGAAAPTTPVLGSAWVGDMLAVWTSDRLRMWNDVTGGSAVPGLDAASLPGEATPVSAEEVADVLPEDVSDAPVPPPMAPGGRLVIRRPVAMVMGGAANGLVVNGMIVNGGFGPGGMNGRMNLPATDAEPDTGPARFTAGVVAGERLVLGTSDGQLAAVDAATGALAWRVQAEGRAPDRLLANAHFVIARFDDPAGSQVMALDATNGKLLGVRRFSANSPGQLVNLALSEEGTLVLTLQNRLLVKDLYEPWKLTPVELVGGPDTSGPAPFAGLGDDQQLLSHQGRVTALYDGGAFLRVHDLSLQNVLGATPQGPVPAEADPLSTGSTTPAVKLYVVGSRLYALTTTSFAQYNLASAGDHYMPVPYDLDDPPRLQDLLLGQDYAIVVDQPKAVQPPAQPMLVPGNFVAPPPDAVAGGRRLTLLLAYSRAPVSASDPKESGKLDFAPTRHDAAGLTAWQAVDGGVCFLTGDQTLHWTLAPASTVP